jgi:hypothetical protein
MPYHCCVTNKQSFCYRSTRFDSKGDLFNIVNFLHRDHPEEVFRDKYHREDLNDHDVARQSRIEQFEIYESLHEIVPDVSVQFREHRFHLSREI